MTIIISLLLLASLLPHLTFTAHVNVSIVNGKEAKPHSRPYMVSIQESWDHICGGFLISDQFVLTAAHCWNNRNLMVVVGAHDLRKSKSSDHIEVESYIPHPDYKPTNKPHHHDADIMLLKLEKKVKLNNKVGVIPLPKKGEDVKAKTACSVAGWGRLTDGSRSNLLMEAKVSIINNNECRNRWGALYSVSQMICVYGHGGTCNGDSGGPLVCGNTAVGVTSFGSCRHCNSSERPNVYSKISAYIEWINKVTGNVK